MTVVHVEASEQTVHVALAGTGIALQSKDDSQLFEGSPSLSN